VIDRSFRDSQPPTQLDRGKKASRRSGCRLHFVKANIRKFENNTCASAGNQT
jgi:hypothetical protein